MAPFRLPFFTALEGSRGVLLAGAGGGYDVFTGLPLYFALREMGKTVHLANLSFARIFNSTARRLTDALVEVRADTQTRESYFPELHLSRWLAGRGDDVPLYCFHRTGYQPVAAAYRYLAEHLGFDTVLLVDGGSDSLLRGDEAGLGSPEEDMVSIAAAHDLHVPTKLLACIGFGVERNHHVCHAHLLASMADLVREGAFLGAWSLTADMPEAALYREAVQAAFAAMPEHPSIVSASILAALDGHFGNYHPTHRTAGSFQFINPLMTLYWTYDLEGLARRILYLDRIRQTRTHAQVCLFLDVFRRQHPGQRWEEIPL